ncbi:MAG: hypothetical protein ACRC5A_01315, partial [Enterobacteriaceae bacterium]
MYMYPGRENDYYRSVGLAEAQQLDFLASSLAHRHIQDYYTRSEFTREVAQFRNDKSRILSLDPRDSYDRSALFAKKKQAMLDLKEER